MLKKYQDLILIAGFIILGILTRTIWHIEANLEFVTAASIIATYFLKNKKLSMIVPFGIMLISDFIIGNTIIFLFTWSAFLVSPFIALVIQKIYKTKKFYIQSLQAQAGGLISTIIFFLWTNLGVVITTKMYDKNLTGLIQSYINALPFLKNQLAGNLVLVPTLFFTTYMFINLNKFIANNLHLRLNFSK